MKYKMMTAKEAIEELFKLDRRRTLDFTFDDLEVDKDCEPSGWHGMRLMKIFDEDNYVFAVGYYGGGSTETYDIYGMVDNSDDTECVKEYCAKKLQMFMDTWCDTFTACEKICVEIK